MKQYRKKTYFYFLFLVPLLAITSLATADTLSIAGLPVRVDRIAQVDSSSVSVTFAGRTEIIAKTDLERHVLQSLLREPELIGRYDTSVLLRFLNQAVAEKKFEFAGWVLQALCLRDTGSSAGDTIAELREVVDAFPDSEGTKAVFNTFLSGADVVQSRQRLVAAVVLLRMSLIDPKTTQQRFKHLALIWEPELRQVVKARIDSALAIRDPNAAIRVIEGAELFWGPSDLSLARFQGLVGRLEQILNAKGDQDFEALMHAWVGVPIEDEYRELFAPLVVEAIHRLVLNALEQGDFEGALRTLAAIDPRRRTQTTHDILRRILDDRKPNPATTLLQPEVTSFIAVIADNDTMVREAYVQALERQIEALVKLGRVHATESFFDRIITLRPDPHPRNDDVRVKQARGYAERRLFDLEREKIAAVKTKSLYWYRFRLFLSDWTFDANRILLYCGIATLLVVWIYHRRHREALSAGGAELGTEGAFEKAALGKGPRATGFSDAPDAQPQAFGSGKGYHSDQRPSPGFLVDELRLMSPSMQEYQRLVHELGLNANADVKSIKTAYRNMVKEVHPDLHQNQDSERSQRFIELTRMYDRILELRKSMGHSD